MSYFSDLDIQAKSVPPSERTYDGWGNYGWVSKKRKPAKQVERKFPTYPHVKYSCRNCGTFEIMPNTTQSQVDYHLKHAGHGINTEFLQELPASK